MLKFIQFSLVIICGIIVALCILSCETVDIAYTAPNQGTFGSLTFDIHLVVAIDATGSPDSVRMQESLRRFLAECTPDNLWCMGITRITVLHFQDDASMAEIVFDRELPHREPPDLEKDARFRLALTDQDREFAKQQILEEFSRQWIADACKCLSDFKLGRIMPHGESLTDLNGLVWRATHSTSKDARMIWLVYTDGCENVDREREIKRADLPDNVLMNVVLLPEDRIRGDSDTRDRSYRIQFETRSVTLRKAVPSACVVPYWQEGVLNMIAQNAAERDISHEKNAE